MSKFPFLRRPVRLILYAALLALVSTAALIFAWQYKLDGMILDHAIDAYAYVGTVVRADGKILDSDLDRDLVSMTGKEPPEMGGPAFLEEIPEGLVTWLEDSKYVTRLDSRETLAAVLGDYRRIKADDTAQTEKVPDEMMSAAATPFYFLQGTVTMQNVLPMDDETDIAWDTYHIQIDKMWSDPECNWTRMIVEFLRSADEAPLQVGQRVFLLGGYIYNGESQVPIEAQTTVYSTGYLRLRSGGRELSVFDENRCTIIPDGVDAERYIQELLDSTGLSEYLQRQIRTKTTVTLRATQDMNMIPAFAKGKAKIYEGRMLTPADIGTKRCVISSGLAQRNRLSPGDTLMLSVADGCYTIDASNWNGGWESGDPGNGDALLEYGEYEEYEIAGIYSQIGRRIQNTLYFPYCDIFVPADADTQAGTVRPYTFSFRVPGPDHVAFLAKFEQVLKEYGYSLVMEDTGWNDVKESFYTMQTRRQLMLLCAAAAFAAAVLVFAVLIGSHCRYEYGLRRLLGARKREAVEIYGAVFLFTAIPGGAAAVAAAWFSAVKLMKDAIAEGSVLMLPTDAQCAGTLAAWAMMELAAVAVVLLTLAWRGERRGLLRLIRR